MDGEGTRKMLRVVWSWRSASIFSCNKGFSFSSLSLLSWFTSNMPLCGEISQTPMIVKLLCNTADSTHFTCLCAKGFLWQFGPALGTAGVPNNWSQPAGRTCCRRTKRLEPCHYFDESVVTGCAKLSQVQRFGHKTHALSLFLSKNLAPTKSAWL